MARTYPGRQPPSENDGILLSFTASLLGSRKEKVKSKEPLLGHLGLIADVEPFKFIYGDPCINAACV